MSNGRLLTDKEIREYYLGSRLTAVKDALKAQLAKDQQHEQTRVEEIFAELDDYFSEMPFGSGILTITRDELKSLKKREGIDG